MHFDQRYLVKVGLEGGPGMHVEGEVASDRDGRLQMTMSTHTSHRPRSSVHTHQSRSEQMEVALSNKTGYEAAIATNRHLSFSNRDLGLCLQSIPSEPRPHRLPDFCLCPPGSRGCDARNRLRSLTHCGPGDGRWKVFLPNHPP